MKDHYLNNMRFAEELLRFLHVDGSLHFGFTPCWELKLPIFELDKQMEVPDYYEDIGWSMLYIINEKVKDLAKCFEDFVHAMGATVDDIYEANFATHALKIAPLFFSKGYSHGAFLGYCAMVLGVAYQFLVLEENGIPHRACQVIGLVLFTHQMTGEFYEEGGWLGLQKVSLDFNKCREELSD